MKKLALVLAFLIGSVASAFAACTSPAVMHDFPGTSFNMSLATNAGDGNCSSNIAIPSGGIASGAVASGAYASGSFSSGAFASGSYASGAFAAGSMVDLLTMRQTVAAGTAASNSMLAGGVYNSSPITLTNGQGAAAQFDVNGYLKTNVTNANANGRAVAASSSPVVPVAAASTAGAIAANNTTAVVVKASAGTLFGVQIYGIGSAPAYLKIYNATSATCGSGTPVKRLMIPAASTAANGAGSNIAFGAGLALGTGITYCVTTGIGDADTTAPAASTFLVNVDYE